MVGIFKSKVRQVGTSLGILLPKEVVKKENLREGQEIDLSILKPNLKLINESFGKVKKAGKFEREHKDRI